MQSITIRQANKDDVSLIANLSWQTFFDTYAKHNTREDMEVFMEKNFSKEVVGKELEDDKTMFFLAYVKKDVVGYVKLSESENPKDLSKENTMEIARFYAVKSKIGSGVGAELMNHCIEVAKTKSKSILWLCVWSQNQRAIQFYRKFGFEKFGDFTFMLGKDAQDDWLMKLDLNSASERY
ncbi:MAG TPA: GNAT family N-acetyltransferase [Segetibacter sp.]|jgi:ribosomal protein S18 acetylase RimI-like enzyme